MIRESNAIYDLHLDHCQWVLSSYPQFNPFPERVSAAGRMKSRGARNFPSSSHQGGVGPTMHTPPHSSIFINTSCSIRKVRLSTEEGGGGMGRGCGWCQALITLNTKYSIDGAGRRRDVFHVINVLPPTRSIQVAIFRLRHFF